jgi:dipeptidyl aminopeptidase/acylaminoacyl peptidase
MRNLTHLIILLLTLTTCIDTQTEENNAFEGDIPKPVSTKISLAGSAEPDIVRFLKVQSAIFPSLSPDGKWVAYRTRVTGDYQIWVKKTDGSGAPKQITFGSSVTFHRWSPDNDWILYATDKDGNEKAGYYFISRDGLREKELLAPTDAYRDFGDFTKDGSKFVYSTTERNGNDFDIHVFDIHKNEDNKLLEGKLGFSPISISPDGKFIVIQETMGEDAYNLHLLNTTDSSLTQINKPDDLSFFGNIKWRSDHRSFFMCTNSGAEYIGIALYDTDNNEFDYVFQDKYDIEQFLTSNNNSLDIVLNENGYSKHIKMDISNGLKDEVSVWPKGTINLSSSVNGSIFLASVRSPKIPGDLWSWVPESDTAVRVTRSSHAGLDLSKMILPEAHSFEARDGLLIHGLLYAPENMSTNTPLVLNVHGGPTAQARPRFIALHQYLIQNGFAIFDLNFRGSTGYGKSYARENNFRKRENELYDLEDAVMYLEQSGLINGEKTAVMGGSYGGYLTMAAMSRLPDVFDCGVAIVGVSNWVTALEGAFPFLKASDRLEYGDIDNPDDRAFFEKISPINYVDQVKGSVMVMHGVNDPRDPVTESDRFVNGIRQNGGEVVYLRFPDEGHGIRKMENRITAYYNVAQFLEDNLK